MNFWVTRNSATLLPPSPSSLTIVPAARGGRSAKSTTSVAALARPTSAVSMPASAADITCSGFFLAAMIPLNDGYRGSLIFSTTLITAGKLPSTVQKPSSDWRGIVTDEPSVSTFEASDSCGTDRRSASIAAIDPIRASVDSAPTITRSNPICWRTCARAYEVCSTSDPASASSSRCTALSAPIDSALRTDSAAFSGPMVKIVTSLPSFFSLICSASSMAYSSSSLINPSTEARSSVASPGFSLRSAHVSGTCLTQTTMFMRDADLPGLDCSRSPTACQTSPALCGGGPACSLTPYYRRVTCAGRRGELDRSGVWGLRQRMRQAGRERGGVGVAGQGP